MTLPLRDTLRFAINRRRITAAVKLLRSTDFEFWGRIEDNARPVEDGILGDRWMERGKNQFEFLKSAGLKPNHVFLDYGCSIAATARYVIPYLADGLYVGCDVSFNNLANGIRRLTALGIERKRYHMLLLRSPELHALHGFSFDFIWAYSSMHYLMPDDFGSVMTKLAAMLKQESIFCVTAAHPQDAKELARQKLHYHDDCEYARFLRGFTLSRHTVDWRNAPISVFRRQSSE